MEGPSKGRTPQLWHPSIHPSCLDKSSRVYTDLRLFYCATDDRPAFQRLVMFYSGLNETARCSLDCGTFSTVRIFSADGLLLVLGGLPRTVFNHPSLPVWQYVGGVSFFPLHQFSLEASHPGIESVNRRGPNLSGWGFIVGFSKVRPHGNVTTVKYNHLSMTKC